MPACTLSLSASYAYVWCRNRGFAAVSIHPDNESERKRRVAAFHPLSDSLSAPVMPNECGKARFCQGGELFAPGDFIFLDELAAHAACLFRKYHTESAFALHSIWPGISLAWTVNNFSPNQEQMSTEREDEETCVSSKRKGDCGVCFGDAAAATLLLLGIWPK
jgi:hypothetical protein